MGGSNLRAVFAASAEGGGPFIFPGGFMAGGVTITKDEAAALLSIDVNPRDCAVIEVMSVQVQALGEGRDANGTPTIIFGFMVPLPAGLLRPKSSVLGPNGQPISGGLMEIIPLPPKVRMLVKLDGLPPSLAEELRATQKVADDSIAANQDAVVVPFPTLRPSGDN